MTSFTRLPVFRHTSTLAWLLILLSLASCGSPRESGLNVPLTSQPAVGKQQTASTSLAQVDPSPVPSSTAAPPTLLPVSQAAPASHPAPTPSERDEFSLCSPLSGIPIDELWLIVSDGYHPPPMGQDQRHQGIDLSFYRRGEQLSILGTPVQAVLAGRVASAYSDTFPFGNAVIIETPRNLLPADLIEALQIQPEQSLYTFYAHMIAAPQVKPDDWVNACDLLGEVGKSGNAGIAHLHLETRLGPAGQTIGRMQYYIPQATEEERANYTLWRMSGTFLHFDPMRLLTFQFTGQ